MAILCFCPPLSWDPPKPTSVWYPSLKSMMKSWAFAILAASSISLWVASLPVDDAPRLMFSAMVPLKSLGSWDTMAMFCLSHLTFRSLRSLPSSRILPSRGS